ncbi:probable inactive DNA (cytosine-5)-methyltransferase DRM3 isoform X2 [Beta vulgaris subsp. vulgaris]|uniref:probable inactive DNA (cytosine-5)-methyltransferase DRM3 isoform X2 n=1 Tax=Beta vulgaris subsp. vulgaris TaxID=3555 RepID=UPI00053FE368|nr:probable inactive DNA (cytosine-5)-methyltransferase DRM3 isoform X2 [Beta vulgaris subsp. vulgaris]XP_057249645.1 probable inactive DNA (cytosine-5)-methyltransferase DRM3 isoform X2 [Beta vulgaris subsp. vulgaris]
MFWGFRPEARPTQPILSLLLKNSLKVIREPDVVLDLDDDKRASLLMMNFPVAEVDFAIDKLGRSAPINELVDFIIAAQIAESENCDDLPNDVHVDRNEDCNTEALFGTMDKTLQLLEMGFNEHEVSLAIEKLGAEVPVIELANCICAGQMGESYLLNPKNTFVPSKTKRPSQDGNWYHIKGMPGHCIDLFSIKAEKLDENYSSQRSSMGLGNMYENIKPKEEYYDDYNLDDIKGKRPKEEYEDGLSTFGGYTRKKSRTLTISNNPLPPRKMPGDKYGMPKLNPTGRSIDKVVYGPPYFLYGNVVNLSTDGWQKVSQFLYALQPEFVNTQDFSALSRTEGYIHNLPTDDRFHINPPSPMTIEEAIPHTKKWWPSWDTRKHLGCISSDAARSSSICSSLGKMLVGSQGVLSGEKQTKVLYYCRTMNLVWVGPQKLAPMEPEHLERILGYPINHTRNPDMTLAERLDSLKNCFQTDTLGYYLSVLKPLFPGGITMLSLYSGIGGAEVTLHRLGLYLKAVVSVESSETRRKVLRRWWQNTDQAGELVQIEGIQKLTSNKLEYLMKKFGGGFDLVICQNPCTYTEKCSTVVPGSSEVAALDYTLFYEFVRVLQRVRTMKGRT